jgi:hypothetical protein
MVLLNQLSRIEHHTDRNLTCMSQAGAWTSMIAHSLVGASEENLRFLNVSSRAAMSHGSNVSCVATCPGGALNYGSREPIPATSPRFRAGSITHNLYGRRRGGLHTFRALNCFVDCRYALNESQASLHDRACYIYSGMSEPW